MGCPVLSKRKVHSSGLDGEVGSEDGKYWIILSYYGLFSETAIAIAELILHIGYMLIKWMNNG